jgi:hypothetical protein
MNEKGIWSAMSLAVRLVVGLFVLAWAGGLIWYGWGLYSTGLPGMQSGGFTLAATGLFLLAPTLIGLIYNLMKRRAPAKRSERPTEPEEVVFDADAAISNYLARKAAQGSAPGAGPGPSGSPRPVFGRRGSAA